jgi:hypothetical protein
MSVINGATVYIDGINRTHNAVMPLKWGDYLDERLDEFNLSLRRIKKRSFLQLTPVEIVLSNKFFIYRDKIKEAKETTAEKNRTKYFLIANDTSQENPRGSGFYDHDISLIEVTKYAEVLTMESRTLTNVLGKSYPLNATKVVPVEA